MKAMILAAGISTRLSPLTLNIPKPLVPVVNRPVMEFIVKLLKKHNFTDIMINVHYLKEDIIDCFKDGSALGVNIYYSDEVKLLGTAGGVKKVADFFDDTFLVIGGDDFASVDLSKLVSFHKEKNALATIGLSKVEDPSHLGIVVTDEQGKILSFQEKPKKEEALSNLANTGIYLFEPEIFSSIPQDEFYDFGKQVFPSLLEQKASFHGFKTDDYWCDVGTIDQYYQTNMDVLNEVVHVPYEKGILIQPKVWIGDNTKIDSSVVLEGPVLIGRNCLLKEGVKIQGPAVIGNNVIISEGSNISKSIIWDNVFMGKEARVDRCVLGISCNICDYHCLAETAMHKDNQTAKFW